MPILCICFFGKIMQKVWHAKSIVIMLMFIELALPLWASELPKEVVWQRPVVTPLWFLDMAKWRVENPGKWLIGHSDREKSEKKAISSAMEDAKTQMSKQKNFVLEFSPFTEYVRCYSNSDYEAHLLYRLISSTCSVVIISQGRYNPNFYYNFLYDLDKNHFGFTTNVFKINKEFTLDEELNNTLRYKGRYNLGKALKNILPENMFSKNEWNLFTEGKIDFELDKGTTILLKMNGKNRIGLRLNKNQLDKIHNYFTEFENIRKNNDGKYFNVKDSQKTFDNVAKNEEPISIDYQIISAGLIKIKQTIGGNVTFSKRLSDTNTFFEAGVFKTPEKTKTFTVFNEGAVFDCEGVKNEKIDYKGFSIGVWLRNPSYIDNSSLDVDIGITYLSVHNSIETRITERLLNKSGDIMGESSNSYSKKNTFDGFGAGIGIKYKRIVLHYQYAVLGAIKNWSFYRNKNDEFHGISVGINF